MNALGFSLTKADVALRHEIRVKCLWQKLRSFILETCYKNHINDARFFFSEYPFSTIKTVCPAIEKKPLSRYFSRCVNVSGRFYAVIDHYTLFSRYFLDDVFVKSHTDEILIVDKTYKNQNMALSICRQDGFSRESELRVKLTFNGQTIVQMGMSLVDQKTLGLDRHGAALWIGIIKSSVPGEAGRENFRQFTKAFDGLRPKYVHVMLIQSLAKALGLSEIFAPSYCGQAVANSRRFKARVHADYDGFWQECGATQINRYLYQLPVERQIRDLADYKPNKRAQAKRRQDLEMDLRMSMRCTFEAMRRQAASD
jgi:uncharacterized protein